MSLMLSPSNLYGQIRGFFRCVRSYFGDLKTGLVVQKESILDGLRFSRSIRPFFSDKLKDDRDARLEGAIVRHYHVIEKGLTMPDFRPRFGQEVVGNLLLLLHEAENGVESTFNYTQVEQGKKVLLAYIQRHQELNVDISDYLKLSDIPSSIIQSEKKYNHSECSGTKPYEPMREEWKKGFNQTVCTRSSVRNFKPDVPVDTLLIEDAIRIALRAPSVCNRQTSRVHLYTDSQAQKLLEFQNGNRGFGHLIPVLLVVTVDLRYFVNPQERSQGWIDGGMFSMLLLLGLHANGLGAVSLNWSVPNKRDRMFRKQSGIPDYERVMMFIGCGHVGANCTVAESLRRTPSSIMTFHAPQNNGDSDE